MKTIVTIKTAGKTYTLTGDKLEKGELKSLINVVDAYLVAKDGSKK